MHLSIYNLLSLRPWTLSVSHSRFARTPLVKHTWLHPNIRWQMFDDSQQVQCSCIAFWQYTRCLRQTRQMFKWVVKCICHVSVSHLVQRPTWQADTNFVFFQIVFTLLTDTSVGWYADQVPCTCSCLLPDTCWSWLASKDSGAVTADTWIKNVANTLKADMCWLVGRVARLSWFNTRQLIPVRVETEGELGPHAKVREMHAWCTHTHKQRCKQHVSETSEGFLTRGDSYLKLSLHLFLFIIKLNNRPFNVWCN